MRKAGIPSSIGLIARCILALACTAAPSDAKGDSMSPKAKKYGGAMWPMLAGVGPLLGGRIIGFFSVRKAKTVDMDLRV